MKFTNFRNFRGLISIGIGDIGGSIIGMIFWFIVASLLEPSNFGELAFFLGIASVTSIVSLLGSGNSLVVFLGKKIPLISTFAVFSMILCAISSIILFIIFQKIELVLLVFTLTIGILGSAILTGKREYKKFGIYNIIQKSSLLIIAFTTFFILNQDYFLLSLGLSYLVFIPVLINGFKESKINKELFILEKNFIFTNYSNTLVSAFRRDIDKFIIPAFLGMATLGQFNLSIQIYSGLMLIPLVLNRFLLAEESAGFSTGKLLKIAIIIQIFISILAIIFLPTILPEFFPQYIETVEMIPIISLSIIPGTLFGLLVARVTANKDNKILIFATSIQIVVLTTGIMTLGISLGAIGLGISHLLSYTLASIFILIMKQSYLKN